MKYSPFIIISGGTVKIWPPGVVNSALTQPSFNNFSSRVSAISIGSGTGRASFMEILVNWNKENFPVNSLSFIAPF